LNAFADLIDHIQPDVVSMENVTRLRTFEKGRIFDGFVDRLEKAGYVVSSFDAYCPDYGIPQQRTRLVLFASKLGRIELIKPTRKPDRYKTVQDAIGKLEPINAGEPSNTDPMHWAPDLSPLNKQRIQASKPGGTWRDWQDKSLIAECHRKKSGETFPSVYGRMEWGEPSPTITTQFFGFGNGRFGHPQQDRAISLREGALLQSFPATYKFVRQGEQPTFENHGRHIGNAVPVQLGKIIARSIKRHLEMLRET
jgi:DNA (cytosine-5)-methyltransferase 1